MYCLVKVGCFDMIIENVTLLLYKTIYLYDEVNFTEASKARAFVKGTLPYWRGKLSIVDLLVLSSLDKLLLIIENVTLL